MEKINRILVLLALIPIFSTFAFSQGADIPSSITITSDNYIFVSGTSMNPSGKMDMVVIGYDAGGKFLRARRIPTTTAGVGIPVGIISNGSNIIVTGTNPDSQTRYDIVTALFSLASLVGVNNETAIQNELILEQSYPNPVSKSGQEATITYTIPETSHIKLSVVDNLGLEVAVLVNEQKETGKYTAIFNPSTLANGSYYYVLQTSSNSQVKKLMVAR